MTPPSDRLTGDSLVSVVITCYNQARFLSDSIGSVLKQTYARYEIVVVDDGSTDDPRSVAERFPRVRFIRQDTQGVAAARNASDLGLEVAVGHGLTYQNVRRFCGIPEIREFSIGHSIIARAVMVGLERAVRDMVALIRG